MLILPGHMGVRSTRQVSSRDDRRVGWGDCVGMAENECGPFECRIKCVQALRLPAIKIQQLENTDS